MRDYKNYTAGDILKTLDSARFEDHTKVDMFVGKSNFLTYKISYKKFYLGVKYNLIVKECSIL